MYVLANNGVLDAYDLKTGDEVYRQRMPPRSAAASAHPRSPRMARSTFERGRRDLVVAAGREFRHIATNSMGETLMATPALSDGVMYVRAARTIFAIGRK